MIRNFNNYFFKLLNLLDRNSMDSKITIINFHRVLDRYDPYNPGALDINLFKSKMETLVKYFNVISLSEAIQYCQNGKIPCRSIVVTIDDGYKDSYTNILPILVELNISATFFIATEGISKGGLWKDLVIESIRNTEFEYINDFEGVQSIDLSTLEKRADFSRLLTRDLKYLSAADRDKKIEDLYTKLGKPEGNSVFLSESEIQSIVSENMEIGAHTHRHPILLMESIEDARKEIISSKKLLEKITKNKVDHFAYPNGKYNVDFCEQHEQIVKEAGFSSGLTTDWGTLSDIESQRFRIPRYTPWNDNEFLFALRLRNSLR